VPSGRGAGKTGQVRACCAPAAEHGAISAAGVPMPSCYPPIGSPLRSASFPGRPRRRTTGTTLDASLAPRTPAAQVDRCWARVISRAPGWSGALARGARCSRPAFGGKPLSPPRPPPIIAGNLQAVL